MHVLIADDHRLVIEGVKLKLGELDPHAVFTLATSVAELFAAVVNSSPDFDLALVDLDMPGASGNSHLIKLRSEHPALPIIVLSGSGDPEIMRSLLDIGVMGFIPKAYPPDVMLSAIRLVMAGGVYVPAMMLQSAADSAAERQAVHAAGNGPAPSVEALRRLLTERQVEVLKLLSNGKPNKVIARELGISEGTVKIHLAAIFRALNVRNRTEAVVSSQRLAETI